MIRNERGVIFITTYLVIAVLTSLLNFASLKALHELLLVQVQRNSEEAFYLAEAGIQRALWVLSNRPLTTDNQAIANAIHDNQATFALGRGNFQATVTTPDVNDPTIRAISITATVGSVRRTIQAQVRYGSWVDKIPGAVYSPSVVEVKFHRRAELDQEAIGTLIDETTPEDPSADPYVDGKGMPGVYSTEGVTTKRKGRGRIEGSPPILENQPVPEGLHDGVWETFDLNALRQVAIANGTYVAADADSDNSTYNNVYNRDGKYTLPWGANSPTEGVFFFDAKAGQPLSDDEINPTNEVRVKLSGTCHPNSQSPRVISGVIVVVGDLEIKDTSECDFQFNGLIIAMDDMKIEDKRTHRRNPLDTINSDILIRGAILSDNVIASGVTRKKKASVKLKNATVVYDPDAIAQAQELAFPKAHWGIIPGTWKESY